MWNQVVMWLHLRLLHGESSYLTFTGTWSSISGGGLSSSVSGGLRSSSAVLPSVFRCALTRLVGGGY